MPPKSLSLEMDPAYNLTATSDNGTAGNWAAHGKGPALYGWVTGVQTVSIPLLLAFGMCGNALAFGCFLSRSLRSASCCLYMAAKCLSDTIFLASLLVTWLDRLRVGILHVQGVCQATVFLSYLTGFVSVWLVVAVTHDNYVRVCRPYLTRRLCSQRLVVMVTSAIVVLAGCLYSFALWTTHVLGSGARQPLCVALAQFQNVLLAMSVLDSLLTLLLPSLAVVVLVGVCLAALTRGCERRNRRQLHPQAQASLLGKAGGPGGMGGADSLETRVVRFLLLVSISFLVLHTPAHLIRLKMIVNTFLQNSSPSAIDVALQRLFETLYYLNFGCSLPIFLTSGRRFRHIFTAMYCRCGTRSNPSPDPPPCSPLPDHAGRELNRPGPRGSRENYAFDHDLSAIRPTE